MTKRNASTLIEKTARESVRIRIVPVRSLSYVWSLDRQGKAFYQVRSLNFAMVCKGWFTVHQRGCISAGLRAGLLSKLLAVYRVLQLKIVVR